MKRIAPALKCSLIALAITACSPAPQAVEEDAGTSVETTARVQSQEISIQEPWVRQPPPSARVAAGYVRIDNPGAEADRLLAVETQAATRVEIHEMEEVDGIMRMREVEGGLEVPAAGHVELMPGGYHLMLMEPREGLAAGQQLEATLVFERAGEVPVVFNVRPVDGAAESHDHAHGDDHGDGHGH
ncbi:copper chaperone PCu(A)C [Luteimonas sp. A478]